MGPVSGNAGLMVAQMALAMLALLAVGFTPPVEGRILLAPLDAQPIEARVFASLGVTRLAVGPLPGSVVVDGERRKLVGLWERRVLVLAAPTARCTGEETGGSSR